MKKISKADLSKQLSPFFAVIEDAKLQHHDLLDIHSLIEKF